MAKQEEFVAHFAEAACRRATSVIGEMSTAAKIAVEVCCSKSKRTRARWANVCGPSTAIELFKLELLNDDAEPTPLCYEVARQLGGQHGE